MKIAAIHIIYYYILVALHMLYLVLTITIKAIFCHHNFRLSEPIPSILALPNNNFKEYNV